MRYPLTQTESMLLSAHNQRPTLRRLESLLLDIEKYDWHIVGRMIPRIEHVFYSDSTAAVYGPRQIRGMSLPFARDVLGCEKNQDCDGGGLIAERVWIHSAMRCLLRVLLVALTGIGTLLSGCVAPTTDTSVGEQPSVSDQPYIRVLGNAQDAGYPQIGTNHRRARDAWDDPSKRRFATSILIADPRSGKRWLIDATPDLRDQTELARNDPPIRRSAPGRPPLFDGVFLTHAHMGHYAGLLQFGREAYGAAEQPVFGSPRMVEFLQTNEPWHLLVELGHITLTPVEPGHTIKLTDDITIEPCVVPHRAEFTDTLGFLIRGPNRSVVFIPDIDKWDQWDTRIEDVIARVDVALLDGTFYSDGEIPGRSMVDIPHPCIRESIARFASLPGTLKSRIRFIHLNHTNPAIDPNTDERRAIEKAGYHVAEQGEMHSL